MVGAHSCEQGDQQQAVLGPWQHVDAFDHRIQPGNSHLLVSLSTTFRWIFHAGGTIANCRAARGRQGASPSIDVDYQQVQIVILIQGQRGPTGCADTCAAITGSLRNSHEPEVHARLHALVMPNRHLICVSSTSIAQPSPRRAAMSATMA